MAALVEGYPDLSIYALGQVKESKNEAKLDPKTPGALETQLQKTKLCRFHMKGLCQHGSSCRFAHGSSELVQTPNLSKTKMCPDLVANGRCKNRQCAFAHHESELKEVSVCHKTLECTWFLAGKCRNGSECRFAHGKHELKGNEKNMAPERKLEPPGLLNKIDFQRRQPMQVQSLMKVPETEPCIPPETSTFYDPRSYETPTPRTVLPSIPTPPPPGFMPGFDYGMQPCVTGYPAAPVHPNYMSMPPVPLMPPFGFEMDDGTAALPISAVPAPGFAPPGFGLQATNNPCELTELAVQINMLSEEVKRLQDWIIPQSMQSTNSGSQHSWSSGSNGTPPARDGQDATPPAEEMDPRSFEKKVVDLQSELQRVIAEGQRSGKIQVLRQSL